MTKASETVLYLATLSAIYFALYTGAIPTSEKFQQAVVPVLPWWALVSFGCYALFCLGHGVYTLNDKPEKYAELVDQIAEAKAELKTHGVLE